MNGNNIQDGIFALVILMIIGVVITIFVLLVGISIRREVREYKNKYEEVKRGNDEIKTFVGTEVQRLLNAFNKLIK